MPRIRGRRSAFLMGVSRWIGSADQPGVQRRPTGLRRLPNGTDDRGGAVRGRRQHGVHDLVDWTVRPGRHLRLRPVLSFHVRHLHPERSVPSSSAEIPFPSICFFALHFS